MVVFRNYTIVLILIMMGTKPLQGWGEDQFTHLANTLTQPSESNPPHSVEVKPDNDSEGQESQGSASSPTEEESPDLPKNTTSTTTHDTPATQDIKTSQEQPKQPQSAHFNSLESSKSNPTEVTSKGNTPKKGASTAAQRSPKKASTQKVRKRSLPTQLDVSAKAQQIRLDASKAPQAALDQASKLPTKLGEGISSIGKLPGIQQSISGAKQVKGTITNTFNQADYLRSPTRREIYQLNRQNDLNTTVNRVKYSETAAQAQKIVQGAGKSLHHVGVTGAKALMNNTKALVATPLKLPKIIGESAAQSTILKNAGRNLSDTRDYMHAGAQKLQNKTKLAPVSKQMRQVAIESKEYLNQKLAPLRTQQQQLRPLGVKLDQQRGVWVDRKIEPARDQFTHVSDSFNNLNTKLKTNWEANVTQPWNYYSNASNELGKLHSQERTEFLEQTRKAEEKLETDRKAEIAENHQSLEDKATSEIEKLQSKKKILLSSQDPPDDPNLNKHVNNLKKNIAKIDREQKIAKIDQDINTIKSDLKKSKEESVKNINKKFEDKRTLFRKAQEEERQNINRRHAYDRKKNLLDYHNNQSEKRKANFDEMQERAKDQLEQKHSAKIERINTQYQGRSEQLKANLQKSLRELENQHQTQLNLIHSKFENKEQMILNQIQIQENEIERKFNYEKNIFEKKHQRSLIDIEHNYEKKIDPLKKEIEAQGNRIRKRFENHRREIERGRNKGIETLKEKTRILQNREIINNNKSVNETNTKYKKLLKGKTDPFERKKIIAIWDAELKIKKELHEQNIKENKVRLSKSIEAYNEYFDQKIFKKFNDGVENIVHEKLINKTKELERLTQEKADKLSIENDTYNKESKKYTPEKLQEGKNTKTGNLRDKITKLNEDQTKEIKRLEDLRSNKINQTSVQYKKIEEELTKSNNNQTKIFNATAKNEKEKLVSIQRKELDAFNKKFNNADDSMMNKYLNTGNKHKALAQSIEKEINEDYGEQKKFREEEAQIKQQNKIQSGGDGEINRSSAMAGNPTGEINEISSRSPTSSSDQAHQKSSTPDSRLTKEPPSISNAQKEPSLDERLSITSENPEDHSLREGKGLPSSSEDVSTSHSSEKGGPYEEGHPSDSAQSSQPSSSNEEPKSTALSEKEKKANVTNHLSESDEVSRENTKKEKNWMQPCMMAAMLDLQFGQRVSSHAQQEKTRRKACKVIKSLNISPTPSLSGTPNTALTDSHLPPTDLSSDSSQSSTVNSRPPQSVQSTIHSVLCLFHAEGCQSSQQSNITEQDLGSRSSAIERGTIDSGLVPNLLSLLGEHGNDFINQALQDGATAALMGITPPSMGQLGASLASINDRAASDPLLSKFFGPNANLALGSQSSSQFDLNISSDSLRRKPSSSDNTPDFTGQWSSHSKNKLAENSFFKSQNSGIWHENTNQNIFQIVSDKISQASNRLY